MRQVVHVDELEAEARRHEAHLAVGEGAAHVARLGDHALGELLDLRQVVVERAHVQPLSRVRAPRLLGRRDRLALTLDERPMQAHEGFEHVIRHRTGCADRGQTEGRVVRAALGAVQLDLECRARGGRGVVEQVGDGHVESLGEGAQERHTRFATAVLHEGELAARDAHALAELVEGQAGRVAEVPQALTEGHEIVHGFTVSKEWPFFPPFFSQDGPYSRSRW